MELKVLLAKNIQLRVTTVEGALLVEEFIHDSWEKITSDTVLFQHAFTFENAANLCYQLINEDLEKEYVK